MHHASHVVGRRPIPATVAGFLAVISVATALTMSSPAIASAAARPTDHVSTRYGAIGKWMLQPDGQIASWLGQTDRGRSIHEPINVLIVDRVSRNPNQARARLLQRLADAGFPARTGHSSGYRGLIGNATYTQEPARPDHAFSDRFYLLENDHGRIFGPAPLKGGGYVWSAAFSRERPQIHPLTHVYVSFRLARDLVTAALVDRGGRNLGWTPLDNADNTATVTTGDHDGRATTVAIR